MIGIELEGLLSIEKLSEESAIVIVLGVIVRKKVCRIPTANYLAWYRRDDPHQLRIVTYAGNK